MAEAGVDAGVVDAGGPQAGGECGVGQVAINGFEPGLAAKAEHPGTPHLAAADGRVEDRSNGGPRGGILALQDETRRAGSAAVDRVVRTCTGGRDGVRESSAPPGWFTTLSVVLPGGTQAAVEFETEQHLGQFRPRVGALGLGSPGCSGGRPGPAARTCATKLPVVTTRPACAAASSGASHPISAKCPRWLVANINSWPSAVSRRCGWSSSTPALHTTASRLSTSSASTEDLSEERSARSSRRWRTRAPGTRERIEAIAASALTVSRLPRMTVAPVPASCSATKYPIPALPPVTRKFLPSARGSRWTSHGWVWAANDMLTPVGWRWSGTVDLRRSFPGE